MNSCASSIRAAACASRAPRCAATSVSRAASSSSSAFASHTGTNWHRNWRRNQAGEVDGATLSTSLKSAADTDLARSTDRPMAAQSAANRLNRISEPGPSGRKRRTVGFSLPNRRVAAALKAARRSAIAVAIHDGCTGSGTPSSAGSSTVARGTSPGTLSAFASASRSIDWLSSRRTSISSRTPPLRTGSRPNRPEAGSKRSDPRGSFTPSAYGRSAEVPPSTRSALPSANARTACRAAAPVRRIFSVRFVSSSGELMSRVSRNWSGLAGSAAT